MLLIKTKQNVLLAAALMATSLFGYADSIDDVIVGKSEAAALAEKQKEASKQMNGMPSVDYAQQMREMKKQRLEALNIQQRTPPKLIEFRGVKNGKYLAKFEMSDGQKLSATNSHPSVGLWRIVKIDGSSVTVRFAKDKNTETELQVNDSLVVSSTSTPQNQNGMPNGAYNPLAMPTMPPIPPSF